MHRPLKIASFQPDQAAKLVRFDAYQMRSESSSASSGAKHAYADQIIFAPQAEPSVRRDSVITGAADIATTLPFDFDDTLKNNPATMPLVIKDNQSLTMVLNTKQGLLANPKLRQAIYHALTMEPMMRAAVGNPAFYTVDQREPHRARRSGSHVGRGHWLCPEQASKMDGLRARGAQCRDIRTSRSVS